MNKNENECYHLIRAFNDCASQQLVTPCKHQQGELLVRNIGQN